jgi:two-component system response regulator FixJ
MERMLADEPISVEEFATAEAFLEGYSKRRIGCVLLDVRLPGLDGMQLLERVADLSPANPIIMISGFGDVPSAVRAVRAGALDFLQKPFRKDQLVGAVRKAFEKIESEAHEDVELQSLTPREREILSELRDGAPNKIVAARLGLSPRTVEMHRARIFRKLGVANLAQALARARKGRLLP